MSLHAAVYFIKPDKEGESISPNGEISERSSVTDTIDADIISQAADPHSIVQVCTVVISRQ